MHLTPTELERLTIFTAAELARRYLRRGIRLAHPEAVAFLADELLTLARQDAPHSQIVAHAATLLTADQVQPGVAHLLKTFSVEVSMAEGTKLVTVFDPIQPAPDDPVPGEVIPEDGDIILNAGRDGTVVTVLNTGDRTIQVRSHAHFFEVNRALHFDRRAAYGMRLDRPSGGGMRFDPGIARQVALVPYAGTRRIHGFAGLVEGQAEEMRDAAMARARDRGYL
ncbi:urease subunit beta [Paracoccus sp. YIM 132242]|uniref:urease n=1 Tax=Paracoccus lichenicola TaxID=2665644 RepID=A0A6L6HT93_9RHOB|nr:urease subunit beta [Paracoccus lichenicola]MTE01471.1 urease subunit beta [Paracoccus lichenicola]